MYMTVYVWCTWQETYKSYNNLTDLNIQVKNYTGTWEHGCKFLSTDFKGLSLFSEYYCPTGKRKCDSVVHTYLKTIGTYLLQPFHAGQLWTENFQVVIFIEPYTYYKTENLKFTKIHKKKLSHLKYIREF